jgi:hypothetical protein
MKSFVSAVAVPAILGLLGVAGFSLEALTCHAERSTGVAGREFVATPVPAACVAAAPVSPLHPSPSAAGGSSSSQGRERLVLPEEGPCLDRGAALVSAQVLVKYLRFRESLTTP